MSAALALAAIRFYQRHLSPRKGYSCALRAATGGASCSAYGYAMIERHGLRLGLALLDRRLALCGRVHRRSRPLPHPLRRSEAGFCDLSCDLPCDGHCDDHGVGECLSDGLGICDCDWPWERKKKRDRVGRRDSRHPDAAAERRRRQAEHERDNQRPPGDN